VSSQPLASKVIKVAVIANSVIFFVIFLLIVSNYWIRCRSSRRSFHPHGSAPVGAGRQWLGNDEMSRPPAPVVVWLCLSGEGEIRLRSPTILASSHSFQLPILSNNKSLSNDWRIYSRRPRITQTL